MIKPQFLMFLTNALLLTGSEVGKSDETGESHRGSPTLKQVNNNASDTSKIVLCQQWNHSRKLIYDQESRNHSSVLSWNQSSGDSNSR